MSHQAWLPQRPWIWVSSGLFLATLYVFLTRGGYPTLGLFTVKGVVPGTSQRQLAEEAADEVEKTPLPPPPKHDFAQLHSFIADLPVDYVPTWDPPVPAPAQAPASIQRATSSIAAPKRRRLIIIGDVHGQLAALRALLRKINFDHGSGDHLVLAGDLVNKGPDSAGVVQLAMDVGASAVRGNHDDKILRVHADLTKAKKPVFNKRDEHHYATVASLSDASVAWLSALSLILRIPMPAGSSPPWNAGQLVVVHAGLVPGLALVEQDPWAVMHMRSLVYPMYESNGLRAWALAEPREFQEGRSWSTVWNRYQNGVARVDERIVVVYGHDAKMGLQVDMEVEIGERDAEVSSESKLDLKKGTKEEQQDEKKDQNREKQFGTRYAFGLDSGCVYGKQLTALILEAGPEGIMHRVEQVDCEAARTR